jgi:hypothetical protein
MPAYLSGSAVPMLQKKIDFYKKIIPLCNSAELLEHKQYIEQRIRGIRYEIRNEKKRDFTLEKSELTLYITPKPLTTF